MNLGFMYKKFKRVNMCDYFKTSVNFFRQKEIEKLKT